MGQVERIEGAVSVVRAQMEAGLRSLDELMEELKAVRAAESGAGGVPLAGPAWMPGVDLMTTPEAAKYVRCSAGYLAALRVRGQGPVYVKMGASVRYERAALDAWVRSRARGSTSAAG